MKAYTELLKMLACPACRQGIEPFYADSAQAILEGLYCPQCLLVYPVREEIPVMLKEEAIPLAEWNSGSRGRKKTGI